MLIVDVWKLRDWRGVHKCAEEEEGERRMWRISQSHAGYLPNKLDRHSRGNSTGSTSSMQRPPSMRPSPLPFPLQSRRFRTLLSPYQAPLNIDSEVPSPKSTTSKPSESLRSCNGRDRTPAHLRIGYSPCRIQRVDRLRCTNQSASSEWGGWGCWRYGPGSERSSLVFSSASSEVAEEEEASRCVA